MVVNGPTRPRRCRRTRHAARLAARRGPDREQGGLRRGRVRRLRGAGRPARTRAGAAPAGPRSTPASCRPPASTARRSSPPRASARRRRAAPGAARDGRPRRLPVRLLHAGLHLLDGRRVLPPRPRGARGRHTRGDTAGPADAPTTSTARTASTCTRSAATSAAAPATGRSATRRTRSVRPQPAIRCAARLSRAGAGAGADPDQQRRRALRAPGRRWPRRSTCSPSIPTPGWSPARPTGASNSTSGTRRAALTIGIDRLAELREPARRRRTASTSAPR